MVLFPSLIYVFICYLIALLPLPTELFCRFVDLFFRKVLLLFHLIISSFFFVPILIPSRILSVPISIFTY